MGRILAGDLFAKALSKEGVRVIFTLCGRHCAPVYLGCEKEGIKVIDVRHEEVAAHAAAGWSRATGQVGVAVVTAGPGVSNSLNGISGAFQTFCPVVEFGGRVPLAEFEMETGQDMDQVRVLEPTTKWARTIWEVRRIPEYVATAFRKPKAPA